MVYPIKITAVIFTGIAFVLFSCSASPSNSSDIDADETTVDIMDDIDFYEEETPDDDTFMWPTDFEIPDYQTTTCELEQVSTYFGKNNGLAKTRDYLYATTTSPGLQIYDVSDETNPVLIDIFDGIGGAWKMRVDGDILYVAQRGDGDDLVLLDITNPMSPTVLGTCTDVDTPVTVSIQGDLAFVSAQDNGVYIVDVSDPTTPELLSQYVYEDPVWDAEAQGDVLYLAATGNGIRALDITDPSHPEEIGHGIAKDYPFDISVAGDVLFATVHRQVLEVFDITDPTNIVSIGHLGPENYLGNTIEPLELRISNDRAYVSCFYGLHIVDVKDPTAMKAVGYYGVNVINGDPYVEDDTLFLGNGGAVDIIDVSDPGDLVLKGRYALPYNTQDVIIRGDYAYLDEGGYGLMIVDISNRENPRTVAELPVLTDYIMMHDDDLYIGTEEDFCKYIFDDTPVPELEGCLGFHIGKPLFHGTYAYVNILSKWLYPEEDSSDTLFGILDISGVPEVAVADESSGIHGILAIYREYLIWTRYGNHLCISDITDPSAPEFLGLFFNKSPDGTYLDNPKKVKIENNKLHTIDSRNRYTVIDLTDIHTPKIVADRQYRKFFDQSFFVGKVRDDLLFSGSDLGVVVYDITHPMNIQERTFYRNRVKLQGTPLDIAGDYLYRARGEAGLEIVDISDCLE